MQTASQEDLTALEVLSSPLFTEGGFRHGFFTRRGGVSQGVYESANFSQQTGDDPLAVEENLRRAALRLGADAGGIFFPLQVHEAELVEVSRDEEQKAFASVRADAVWTRTPGRAVAVRTADCVPILLGCRKTGLVAAVHSGWRGSAVNIVGKTVESLRRSGASDLVAAIGPHISLASFEVSEEVAKILATACPDPEIVERTGPRPHVDLRRMTVWQLVTAGVLPENIDHIFGCTVREPDRFFSFRRDGEKSGRLLSAILAR